MRFATPSWQAAAGESDGGGAPSLPLGSKERFAPWCGSNFVPIGRGAAPPGPLTSGVAVAASRAVGSHKNPRIDGIRGTQHRGVSAADDGDEFVSCALLGPETRTRHAADSTRTEIVV